MNVIGQTHDPFLTLGIQVANAEFLQKPSDSEHDWREGSEQHKFIEHCLATVDRKQQPWLIFSAHRPLGYSSNAWYAGEGSFEEPMGRESLQGRWQKYKVDIAFYGHVHNYERVCPIYQNQCVNKEKSHYSGTVNGTIHVVVGGGGSHLSDFTTAPPVISSHDQKEKTIIIFPTIFENSIAK
ncbi:unnamed protein product [Vicia faba]|uniref:Calcineurin-like phosphoesterase domain-containing protein n=1 Tax=Vicia faba TaxID=3906 RepID=A0AAV0ZGL3_VICFA|nr:unnamed protein product [Vicia faba]